MPKSSRTSHRLEKDRFQFGKNWKSYLKSLQPAHIKNAHDSFVEVIQKSSLKGLTFIDVGCGSGLSSLVAYRLGAKKIVSFDYDSESVEATQQIKLRFAAKARNWQVSQGSILDTSFLKKLGTFDVVYSWGVLHHTGQLWQACENASTLVKKNGLLFVALYNDQGGTSKRWRFIKKSYVSSGYLGKWFWIIVVGLWFELWRAACNLIKGRNPLPFRYWQTYKENRGMSVWHDLVDWVGGYPFEVAKPEQVFHFFHQRGFVLENIKTVGGELGNNEFVFRKMS